MRALFTRDSYIEIPVSNIPLYVECDIEWTPDQYEHWIPANLANPYGSSDFIRFENSSHGAFNYFAASHIYGWVDALSLGSHAPFSPVDGRGKYHVKIETTSSTYKVTIDGTLVESGTWPFTSGFVSYLRFGLVSGFYRNPDPNGVDETVYMDNIKVGTISGGTDIANLTFEGGTPFGGFTTSGTISIVSDASTLNEDAHDVRLNFTPSFDTPFSTRGLCLPIPGASAYLEHVLATPVDTATDSLYGSVELSWLYGHSYVWTVPFIELLDSSNVVIDSLKVFGDDLDWEYRTAEGSVFDTSMNWPSSGKKLVKFALSGGSMTWTIGEETVTGTPDAGTIAKIRFGYTENLGTSSWMRGAAIFVDNIGIGATPAYELISEDFEDGTSGALTEVGNIIYPEPTLAPSKFNFIPPSSGVDVFIWIGDLGESPDPIWIEFDVSWTPTEEAGFGTYTGNFFLIQSRNGSWAQYLYHDGTDGWYDNDSLFVSDPLTGVGGTHHIKVCHEPPITTHMIIDSVDHGPLTITGSVDYIDSIQFGWAAGGDDLGGCTIENLTIGTTDGGAEIYDGTTDLRNPYEVFSISPGVTYEETAHDPVEFTDAGTVGFKFTPHTVKEVICHSRIQIDAEVYKRWQSVARVSYLMDVRQRWSGTALVDQPVQDPC